LGENYHFYKIKPSFIRQELAFYFGAKIEYCAITQVSSPNINDRENPESIDISTNTTTTTTTDKLVLGYRVIVQYMPHKLCSRDMMITLEGAYHFDLNKSQLTEERYGKLSALSNAVSNINRYKNIYAEHMQSYVEDYKSLFRKDTNVYKLFS